ncbi:selenocysteine insertion sequence-binding protein 2 [Nephila pilipes]|uniref:Selenocysteine insertion sequence-binding protein 2 n=1 Tax=Nephila pilipes TaxID=299642 RepID=A0A8X6I8F1_NEPPI|nr:selenocysteine insertion sequence-binding protein 2 [Nephila pilipes]
MNKGKKSQGIIRIPDNENHFIQQQQNQIARDNKRVFKVDSHDFPSLSEVSEANKKQERNSMKCDFSDFTYSAKLKVQPQEKVSQSKQFENSFQNKPKSASFSTGKLSSFSKNESMCIKSKTSNNDECTIKSSQTIQSVSLDCKRQQSLSAKNKLTPNNKNLSHTLRNSSISEEKTEQSELVSHKSDSLWKQKDQSNYRNNHNICSNENNFLTQKCANAQRRSGTAHGEPPSSLKKEKKSFDKNLRDNFDTISSVKDPVVSNGSSDTRGWRTTSNYVSSGKNQISFHKSNEWTIIEKKSKRSEANKPVNSTSVNNTNIRQSHQNITQSSVSGNVHRIKTQKTTLNPKLSSNSENKTKSKALNAQQTSGTVVEVKKKRKRKSRLKRQAALQSGKILVLTPEVHSKIVNQSNNENIQKHKNILANINDCEEYPELGSSKPKSNKEYSEKILGMSSKTEFPVNSVINGLEMNKCGVGSDIPEDASATSNVFEASKSEAKNNTLIDNLEEKKVVHSNNPITLSLFDMLLAAKPKKKEPEKKDELPEAITSPLKVKKETTRKVINNAVVNPLDSSKPSVKRGKEREEPKVKRPSRLRKLILLGRQQKRENMIIKNIESESNDSFSDEGNALPKKYVELDEIKPDDLIPEINSLYFTDENKEVVSLDLSDWKEDLFTNHDKENENVIQNFATCDEIKQKNWQRDTDHTKHENYVLETCAEPTTISEESESSDIEDKLLRSNICLLNSFEVKECDTFDVVPRICNKSEYKSSEEFVLRHNNSDIPFLSENENSNQMSECSFNNKLVYFEDHNDIIHNETDTNCLEYKSDECAVDVQSKNGLNSNFIDTFSNISWLYEKQDNSLKNLVETPNAAKEDICEKKLQNVKFITDNIIEIKNKIEAIPVTKNTSYTCNFINDAPISGDQITDDNKSLENNIFTIDFNLTNSNNMEDQSDAMKVDKILSHSSEEINSYASKNLYSDQKRFQATKLLLHSRKFRQYCNHFISKEIDEAAFALIDDLARFQDRMHQKDPVKAKIRRRLVYGIKEIKKHMKLKKIKCILIATDIEDIRIEGGLNDIIEELKSLADTYHIPYIFSHRRFNLGKICRKSVPVSCVGIFNYEGSEKNFKKMIELHENSKCDYSELTKKIAFELTNEQMKELFEAEKESLLVLREVSQRILRGMFHSNPEEFQICENCNINSDLTSCAQFSNNKLSNVETTISFPSKQCSNSEKNSDALLHKNINIILTKYKVVKD